MGIGMGLSWNIDLAFTPGLPRRALHSEDSGVSRDAQWRRFVPAEPCLVPILPSMAYLRRQFDHFHITTSQGASGTKQMDPDLLLSLVAHQIHALPAQDWTTVPSQNFIELGVDDANENDFIVGPEHLFKHPSQLGLTAGYGAYPWRDIVGPNNKMPVGYYGTAFYFLSVTPEKSPEPGSQGGSDLSQARLDAEHRAVEGSAWRFMFPEIEWGGIIFRLGVDANPKNVNTEACLTAYQAAGRREGVTVSAGCGARINHATADGSSSVSVTSNARSFWFTVKSSSGRLYPCTCLLYTSPSPRDGLLSRMPSSA